MAIKTNLFLFYKLIYFWFVFLPSGAYFGLYIALLVIARMNNRLNIKYHFDEQNSEHLKKKLHSLQVKENAEVALIL